MIKSNHFLEYEELYDEFRDVVPLKRFESGELNGENIVNSLRLLRNVGVLRDCC